MRIFLLALLGLGAGVAIGYGHNWYDVGDINEQFRLLNTPPANGELLSTKAPRVDVMGGTLHDFGVMERLGKRHHTFVIRNVGTAALTLEQ